MDKDALCEIAVLFHEGTDRGQPVDCCGVEAVIERFVPWAEEQYPEIVGGRSWKAIRVESCLIDERGIDDVADFFRTIEDAHVPTILESFRAHIERYYGGRELDPKSTNQLEQIAAEALEKIRALSQA